MLNTGQTDARKLHSRLNHPIIDADGHWIEYGPVMREEFRKIGRASCREECTSVCRSRWSPYH